MTEDLWEAPCCRSPSSSERCQDCGNCPEHCECETKEIRCSISSDEGREYFNELTRAAQKAMAEYQFACILEKERYLERCFDACWRE